MYKVKNTSRSDIFACVNGHSSDRHSCLSLVLVIGTVELLCKTVFLDFKVAYLKVNKLNWKGFIKFCIKIVLGANYFFVILNIFYSRIKEKRSCFRFLLNI